MNTVTVLMAVHQSDTYLPLAIESILNQTWPDFVFLIIDDGSTDETAKTLAQYQLKDARIRIHRLPQNKGLGFALSEGVKLADTDLIARMDADDIAAPERLATQVEYLQGHSDIDLVGSYAMNINKDGAPTRLRVMPTEPDTIADLIWTNPLIHPSIMFRRRRILDAGNYNPALRRRQDYELWFRAIARGLRFANIPLPLIFYRYSDDTLRRNSFKAAWNQAHIGWRGCVLVKARPQAYIGVAVPLIAGLMPVGLQRIIRRWMVYADPRQKRSS